MSVVIVGGGLAGLALADHLERAGLDWTLIEARDRLGGRIKGLRDGDATFDLGPSWFWPGQPRMAALVRRLNLQVFDQYASGAQLFEPREGQVQQSHAPGGMAGSLRVSGGMPALIDTLAEQLPKSRIRLDTAVSQINQEAGVITADGDSVPAARIVLALPPRVTAGLDFVPDLPAPARQAMLACPTWMGGQAKFVATYDTPFWRDAGLSGDGFSHRGPLVEIHDASALGGPAALFGFVGIPAPSRRGQSQVIAQAALDQLGRLFGPQALSPRTTALQDWAFSPETAHPADHEPLRAHPTYGLPPEVQNLWDGALLMGGSEVASDFGGYLEGALARAEDIARELSTAEIGHARR